MLTLMLSGLVRCAVCGASMQPLTSGRAAKPRHRYVYYVCPRLRSGACQNRTSVREDYLRQAVVSTLRQKLFPMDPRQAAPAWLPALFDQVRAELEKLSDQGPDRRDALQHQVAQVDEQTAGWLQSLGKPALPMPLRTELERQFAAASERRVELDRELRQLDQLKQATEDLLNVRDVLARLKRLDMVLAGSNPTLANVELSRHIDRIDVHADGRVVLHACRLGVLEGADRLLRAGDACPAAAIPALASSLSEPLPGAMTRVAPRARAKLRVDADDLENPAEDLDAAVTSSVSVGSIRHGSGRPVGDAADSFLV